MCIQTMNQNAKTKLPKCIDPQFDQVKGSIFILVHAPENIFHIQIVQVSWYPFFFGMFFFFLIHDISKGWKNK